MVVEIITGILDKIPTIIVGARGLIMKLLSTLNLPEQNGFMVVALILSFVGAYFWIRQWITTSLFLRLSTILNYILIAILIYISLVYVK